MCFKIWKKKNYKPQLDEIETTTKKKGILKPNGMIKQINLYNFVF